MLHSRLEPAPRPSNKTAAERKKFLPTCAVKPYQFSRNSTMTKRPFFLSPLIVAAALAFAFSQTVGASEEALLDLLVKKKLITPQDAAAVRAELKAETKSQSHSSSTLATDSSKSVELPVTKTSSDKWKLSTPITELELY